MRHTAPTGIAVAAVAVIALGAAASALPEVVRGPNPGSGAKTAQPPAAAARNVAAVLASDPAQAPVPEPTVFVLIPTPTPGPATPEPEAKTKPRATPVPDTVANAKAYALNRLGATQYGCLDKIFTYESKWNPLATNPRSGAYGIPQAYPGSKMAAFGSNWRTSPLTQVKWGIWYVNDRYGSACDAWAFIQANGWY